MITNVLPCCDTCGLERRKNPRSLTAEIAFRREQNRDFEPFIDGCALAATGMRVCGCPLTH